MRQNKEEAIDNVELYAKLYAPGKLWWLRNPTPFVFQEMASCKKYILDLD